MSQMLCTDLGESFSLPAILQERCYLFSDQETDALKDACFPQGLSLLERGRPDM